MSSPRGSVQVRIATLLALLLVALTMAPAEAAPRRFQKLERFALELINCTRTGGWVQSDGSCKGYGSGKHSRYRPPLKFHRGVADEVAWPWARRIARAGYCGHTLSGSSLDERFRSAGFKNRFRGENLGCSYAWKARKMVIRTHRMMQREKAYRGVHWRQMKNPDFRSAGIAVVQVGSNTRLVVDFYGRREQAGS